MLELWEHLHKSSVDALSRVILQRMPPSAPNPFAPAPALSGEIGVFRRCRAAEKEVSVSIDCCSTRLTLDEKHHRLRSRSSIQIYAESVLTPAETQANTSPGPVVHLTYNGWWFVQRVHLNGKMVWWAISWLKIESSLEIDLRTDNRDWEATSFPSKVRIEIDFSRGLQIRRFRIWFDQEIRYDEIS